jgi:hypothetical protein
MERRRLTAVLLENHPHTVSVPLDNRARLVGRTVVNDDNLAVRVGLRERALDSRRHEQRVVVVVDNHADKGLCHSNCIPFCGGVPSCCVGQARRVGGNESIMYGEAWR